ncbi:unnamed protein product [Blepharisma stoltei]|uniref:Uncharacterized protein n=1 Tax=Blepharisma stoltei TaxID=1481888 RepID=A0AAU9IJN0_9CILI|nr:unnamed protein product [Blepharisma stoltei]
MKSRNSYKESISDEQILNQSPKIKILQKEVEILADNYHVLYMSEFRSLGTINIWTHKNSLKKLRLPEKAANRFTAICRIPGNKIFCYGGVKFDGSWSGMTFTIDSNNEIEIFESGNPCIQACCIYFDGCVYTIGGLTNQFKRFNLSLKMWQKRVECHSQRFSTGGQIQGFIIYSNLEDGINIYDPYANTHQTVLSLPHSWKNVFVGSNNRTYCFQFYESIYESGFNNVFKWNNIGKCNLVLKDIFGCPTNFCNKIYFLNGDDVCEFDLGKKQIKVSFSFTWLGAYSECCTF